MYEVLQKLVEELAQRLRRSVTVDDASLGLVVCSTHFEEPDPARLSSLVGRRVVGEAREYLLTAGIMSWKSMHRVPPNPSVGGTYGRICFPLRSRYELLGFMSIIDDGLMSDDDMMAAQTTALQIQNVMARKTQSMTDNDLETEALVLALLSLSPHDRSQAAKDISDFGLLKGALRFSAIAVSISPTFVSANEEPAADLIRRALLYSTQSLSPGSYAYAASGTESCLILGYRTSGHTEELLRLANAIHHGLSRGSPALAESTWVGIGQPAHQLENVSLSFDQAMNSIRVGRARGTAVNSWADSTLDALLSALLVQEYGHHMIPDLLRVLDSEPLETSLMLETFLDNAGNVISTADKLHLHRTTIYYRLSRFQKLTGLDLEDGTTRLMLHLWLKSKPYSTAV